MTYVKDVNTSEELFWVSFRDWAFRFISDHNFHNKEDRWSIVKRTTDSKGNLTIWVERNKEA